MSRASRRAAGRGAHRVECPVERQRFGQLADESRSRAPGGPPPRATARRRSPAPRYGCAFRTAHSTARSPRLPGATVLEPDLLHRAPPFQVFRKRGEGNPVPEERAPGPRGPGRNSGNSRRSAPPPPRGGGPGRPSAWDGGTNTTILHAPEDGSRGSAGGSRVAAGGGPSRAKRLPRSQRRRWCARR